MDALPSPAGGATRWLKQTARPRSVGARRCPDQRTLVIFKRRPRRRTIEADQNERQFIVQSAVELRKSRRPPLKYLLAEQL